MRKTIKLLEVKEGSATHIKIQLSYTKGGMNYFSSCSESRGLWLSVTPVSRTNHEGGLVSESCTAFSGTKKHVKDMARFNQKAFDSFEVSETDIKQLLDQVLNKNGITLKQTENV